MPDPDRMTCPHCEAVGVVEGIAEEVVPKTIQCGHCRQLFPYRPSSWDYIREDYDGEQSPFYLKVVSKPDNPPHIKDTRSEEDLRRHHLKVAHTRVLLDVYRRARLGSSTPPDASIRWPGSRCDFTGAEVQAELALREHVLNKREGEALRRAKAQGENPLWSPKRRFDL